MPSGTVTAVEYRPDLLVVARVCTHGCHGVRQLGTCSHQLGTGSQQLGTDSHAKSFSHLSSCEKCPNFRLSAGSKISVPLVLRTSGYSAT